MSNRTCDAAAIAACVGDWSLPSGWKWLPAKAVLPLEYGKALKADGRNAGPIEVFGSAGRIGFHDQALCSEPALIVGRKGSAGSVYFTDKPSFTIDTAYYCRESAAAVDLRYGYYYLQFARLAKLDQSTAVPSLSRDSYDTTPVPVPNRATQQAIASRIDSLFSEIDDGEAALGRARGDLEVYRRALLKAAVTGELTADWRAANPPRETGAELLARILAERRARWHADPKNSGRSYVEPAVHEKQVLRALPPGWEWASLAQLSSENDRSFQSGPFGSALLHSEFSSSGKLVIGIDNVRDGFFSLGRQHRISPAKFSALERFRVRPSDLLITVMATIGRACVVPTQIEDALVTKHVYRITLDRNAVVPEHVLNCVRGCRETLGFLYTNVRGQTRPGLNKDILERTPIPLMPLAEQIECLRLLSIQFAQAVDGENAISTCYQETKLRQSVLSAAFRGELLPS